MKTGAYWFKFLTDKEQEEFKVNCGGKFDEYLNKKHDSFGLFIALKFSWMNTEQGEDYWHEISQRKTD